MAAKIIESTETTFKFWGFDSNKFDKLYPNGTNGIPLDECRKLFETAYVNCCIEYIDEDAVKITHDGVEKIVKVVPCDEHEYVYRIQKTQVKSKGEAKGLLEEIKELFNLSECWCMSFFRSVSENTKPYKKYA